MPTVALRYFFTPGSTVYQLAGVRVDRLPASLPAALRALIAAEVLDGAELGGEPLGASGSLWWERDGVALLAPTH